MGKDYFRSKYFILTLLVSCNFANIAETYKPKVEAKNVENSTTYALGRIIGKGLRKFKLTEEDVYLIHKGIFDETQSKPTNVDYQFFEDKINELLNFKQALNIKKNLDNGIVFLKKLKEKGFKETEENFLIDIKKKGDPFIDKDYAVVTITGKRSTGKKFSFFKKTKVYLDSLPIGLKKGILATGRGGKSVIAFSHEYGFGLKGSGDIEGGEALTFDLKVLKLSK